MDLPIRQRGSVAILEPEGRITFGAAKLTLREAVLEIVGSGTRDILLDLSRVPKGDSSSVGEMVHAYTSLSNRKARLRLLSPRPPVLAVLQITGIDTVFKIFEDEGEAVASFEEGGSDSGRR